MDINQLEVLSIVARERSFSRAAEMLNRTQPAISQSVRRLEQEIGEKLFDRSSKDGTLTLAGEILLDYARQMINLRQTAHDAIREMRDLQHGKVTVSANEHTVFYLLPVIKEFRRPHPQIKARLISALQRIPSKLWRAKSSWELFFSRTINSVVSVWLQGRIGAYCIPNHFFGG